MFFFSFAAIGFSASYFVILKADGWGWENAIAFAINELLLIPIPSYPPVRYMVDWCAKYCLGSVHPQSSSHLTPKALGLLLLAVALFSPSAARAASFSDRAVIGLFRGGGSLLGPFSVDTDPSGIDGLASHIAAAFPDHNLTVQVFDSYAGNIFDFQEVGSSQGAALINQFDDVGAIGLIGYSAGGISAIRTAHYQSPVSIDLLVQIDSYEPLTGRDSEDEILPPNVETGINYYQRRNRYNFFGPGWDPSDLGGAKDVKGAQNINVEDLFGDRTITHRTIDDDPRLRDRIVQDIATYVLPNLTVPSLPTSDLKDAPILLPGPQEPTAIAGSGLPVGLNQWADPDDATVPEPRMLWALGAIGVILCGMREKP